MNISNAARSIRAQSRRLDPTREQPIDPDLAEEAPRGVQVQGPGHAPDPAGE